MTSVIGEIFFSKRPVSFRSVPGNPGWPSDVCPLFWLSPSRSVPPSSSAAFCAAFPSAYPAPRAVPFLCVLRVLLAGLPLFFTCCPVRFSPPARMNENCHSRSPLIDSHGRSLLRGVSFGFFRFFSFFSPFGSYFRDLGKGPLTIRTENGRLLRGIREILQMIFKPARCLPSQY